MTNKVALTACMLAVLGIASTANAGTTRSGGGRGGNSFGGHSGSHSFGSHNLSSGHANGVSLGHSGSHSNTRGTVYHTGQTSIQAGAVSHQGVTAVETSEGTVVRVGKTTAKQQSTELRTLSHKSGVKVNVNGQDAFSRSGSTHEAAGRYRKAGVHKASAVKGSSTHTGSIKTVYNGSRALNHQGDTVIVGDSKSVHHTGDTSAIIQQSSGKIKYIDHSGYFNSDSYGTTINHHEGNAVVNFINGTVNHEGYTSWTRMDGSEKSGYHEGIFANSLDEAGSKDIHHEGSTAVNVQETRVMSRTASLDTDASEDWIYHVFSTSLFGDEGKVWNRSGSTALKGENGWVHNGYIGVSQNGANINAHQGNTDVDNVNGSKSHWAYSWLTTPSEYIVHYGNISVDDRGWIHMSDVEQNNNTIHNATTSHQNGSLYHKGTFKFVVDNGEELYHTGTFSASTNSDGTKNVEHKGYTKKSNYGTTY